MLSRSDALGEVNIGARHGETTLHGSGVATDVVEASARAWVRIHNMVVAGMGTERRQGEFAPGRI